MKIEPRVVRSLCVIAFVAFTAALASYFTSVGMQGWYQSLILPDFVPSGQFIGIIWTVLYALLALSAIMAMDEWPRRSPGRLAAFYLVNGILNVAWCYLFFTLHRIDVAFLACIALLLSVALLIVENFRFKRFAGFLLLPYLIWVAFAGYLNYSIWSLNHNVQPPQISSEGNSAEKLDRIRLSTPAAGDVIKSPLHIEGEARGTWYFEASFPVTLEDGNGTVLASGHADAKSDWMTEDFVPFTADLSFKSPSTNTGRLVLHRDNPSGLPENDDELWVPVAFKSITASENLSNLKVGDSFVHGNIRGKVIEINDSRCKSGVVCIWQGEISVVLSVALNGDSDVPGGTIRIGTEVRQSETLLGHTFSLRSAAADSVTLVITP